MHWKAKIAMIVVGIVCLGIGNDKSRLGVAYDEKAREVTPRKLLESSRFDNRHVRLTRFRPIIDETVYMYVEGSKRWDSVYVPVRTSSSSGQLQIVITSKKVDGETQLEALVAHKELEGLLVNGVDSLDPKAQKLLAESFPKTDFSKIWLLDVDKTSPGSAWPFYVAGLGLIIGGIASFFAGRRQSAVPAPQPVGRRMA